MLMTLVISAVSIIALCTQYQADSVPAVGFVVLLYDHLLTFELERKYVWNAPRSFSKFAFLFNRYMVLCCLVAITCGEYSAFSIRFCLEAHERSQDMCGFSFTLTDWVCISLLPISLTPPNHDVFVGVSSATTHKQSSIHGTRTSGVNHSYSRCQCLASPPSVPPMCLCC